MKHVEILQLLIKRYGSREALALVLGTTANAIYFWQLRETIPDHWHGKILALAENDFLAHELIPGFRKIQETHRKMKRG